MNDLLIWGKKAVWIENYRSCIRTVICRIFHPFTGYGHRGQDIGYQGANKEIITLFVDMIVELNKAVRAMKTIYKYPLKIQDTNHLSLPCGFKILTAQAQVQDGAIHLWAEVDTEEKANDHITINIFGTGNPIFTNTGTYINTVQLNGFVWHIFRAL